MFKVWVASHHWSRLLAVLVLSVVFGAVVVGGGFVVEALMACHFCLGVTGLLLASYVGGLVFKAWLERVFGDYNEL